MSNAELNVAGLKSFATSAVAREAVAAWMATKANAEAQAEAVAELVAPLLAEMQIMTEEYTTRSGDLRPARVITNEDDLYLSDDEEKCNAYYARKHELLIGAGYDVKPDYCPACIARTEHTDAEIALLRATDEALGTPFVGSFGKRRKQIVDLLVRLVVSS